MTELYNFAEDLLSESISVVAVKQDKSPTHKLADLFNRPMGLEFAEQVFNSAWGIGAICGKVSGDLECIDFDSHDNNIKEIFTEWAKESGVNDILRRNKVYVEKSMRGGYHLLYRFDAGDQKYGSEKLARWETGDTMIETRGEGSYVVVAPSPGYKKLKGDLSDLPELTIEERDYLLNHAKSFNKFTASTVVEEAVEGAFDNTDPVSWFNWNKGGYAKLILKDKGWNCLGFDEKTGIEQWRRPGKSDGISATWGNKHNAFYMFTTSWPELSDKVYYTPFQLVVKLRFDGEYMTALNWIIHKYFYEDDKIPYLRVGTDYYKRIEKVDRFGIKRIELKVWKKDEIKQDHGREIFKLIQKYDDFDIEPDNLQHSPIIRNCYNLYKEFPHSQKNGGFVWSGRLLEHVFGEQAALGIRYMQALYLYPKRLLPILVLVSKERQTGKTTFINWLNMIFGANMTNINPEDLAGSFNSAYATSNIIAVEETLIEKSITVEKLKSLATGKFLSVNQKYVSPYKVPFFGKIILASNNEEKFARIDEEEIRFFVRKLEHPKFKNHDIEANLVDEIPAFLHYLSTLPAIDWSLDRSGFTPEELVNEQLLQVKKESKSSLYKDLFHLFTDLFNNHPSNSTEVSFTPSDVKSLWFAHDGRIGIQYIAFVLRNEFKIEPDEKVSRYFPFGMQYDSKGSFSEKKVGLCYTLHADTFVNSRIDDKTESVNDEPW